ncbi:MAG: GGDEF domain-containing protein [Betaproteobacteria bacterium]
MAPKGPAQGRDVAGKTGLATPLTGFDPRTSFWLCVITVVGLLPFALFHWIRGDLYTAVIVGGLTLVAITIATAIYRMGALPPALLITGCLIGNVVIFLAVQRMRMPVIFWVYPILIFNYSMIGTRLANWTNICFCLAIWICTYHWIDPTYWPRLVVTMTLTVLFGYIFSSNIDRQKRALHEMASVDPLTGARNRREMQLGIKHACKLRDRFGTPSSLLLFDLDFFKQVNDLHGHAIGDRVLIDLVELVSKRLRATDTLYRYGGEEFVVLASSTSQQDGRQLAESLCELVRGSRLGGLPDIRISIGVAEYLPPELPAAWLKRADEALYRAKANGRNRIEVA